MDIQQIIGIIVICSGALAVVLQMIGFIEVITYFFYYEYAVTFKIALFIWPLCLLLAFVTALTNVIRQSKGHVRLSVCSAVSSCFCWFVASGTSIAFGFGTIVSVLGGCLGFITFLLTIVIMCKTNDKHHAASRPQRQQLHVVSDGQLQCMQVPFQNMPLQPLVPQGYYQQINAGAGHVASPVAEDEKPPPYQELPI